MHTEFWSKNLNGREVGVDRKIILKCRYLKEIVWRSVNWIHSAQDIGKYSFVNRAIQRWNQVPADALGTLSCKPSNFRKRVRKVINRVK
jgi:hypothetical protein